MKKPPAEDCTINMFSGKSEINARAIEVIEETERDGERVLVEQDADRVRENAFKGQEWTSKYFGSTDAPGNEYRMSYRGGHYYLETILKEHGKPLAYGYTGIMIRECDLLEATKVMVAAVREKQARDQ